MFGWEEFGPRYRAGKWEPRTKALVDTLSPGDVFVDVGAWIGPVTLWALDRGAIVYAIEPDPVAAAAFRRTIGERDDVHFLQAALAPAGGTVNISPEPRGEFGGSETRVTSEGLEVPAVTLEDVLGGVVPALVKIDVEGYETTLCPAIVPWLAEHQVPVQISLHGEHLPRELFDGYSDVKIPVSDRGDIVALP